MEKKNTHVMYGLFAGIAMIIIGLILYLTGLAFKNSSMQYVSQIPFLLGVILNALAFSKANDGFVTFGNVFGSCFKMSMIVALMMVAWSVISIYIFPEMKDKILEMIREGMAKRKGMTDEQMEMSISFTKKYWNTIAIAGALFNTLFYGAIFSLIGGAIAKKKGLPPITADNI